jgi:hypothetical protein
MSSAANWTPEEARLLYNAPFAAATYVSLASGGMIDFVKEMAAANRFLCEQTRPGHYGELVDALLAGFHGMSRAQMRELEFLYNSGDLTTLRTEAREVVAGAAAVLGTLPGADGYRQWLMAAAHAAALAGSGTLLPGGGDRPEIDPHEQAAIEELAGILLGVKR